MTHLNDLSKAYLEQIAEKKKDDTYLEPDMKKRQANNEKARKDLMKGPQMKNPHFEEKQLDPVGKEDADIDNDGDKDKSDKYLLRRRKVIDKAMAKESFLTSDWRKEISEVMNDIDSAPIKGKKGIKNKVTICPKMSEAVEEIGGTLIEMIEVDEFDYVIESVYDELIEEGYSEDDVEEAIAIAMEATVTFGHDTDKPHEKDTSKVGKVKAVGRLARQKLKSAGKKVKLKSAQAQVAAYNKGREVAQTAGDKARRAKKAVTDAPKKAKTSIKSRIRKMAQKVVDRMSEEVVRETYTITNADKAGDKRYKAADHMKEGVRDVDPEKGTAERKARLEKKRGMKLDDHPQYKKEEVEQVDEGKSDRPLGVMHQFARGVKQKRGEKREKKYGMDSEGNRVGKYVKGGSRAVYPEEVEQVDENRAAMGRINKEYHRKKEAEAMAARTRDPKVKRDLPKRKNDNPMYDPKSAGSSRVKDFKFTGEEVEVDEAMSSYDRNRKRAAQRAAERNAARAAGKTGVVPGVGYVSPRKERETYVDSAGTTRHKSGAKMEEVEIEEGIVDTLKGAAKGAKKGVEKARKFQQAPYKAVDRMQRMTRHKQDKYGPSTLKQRVMTGADHNIDNERKAKMKTEEASMSPQEVQLQKKKAMIDKMIATKRMQGLKKSASAEPAKAMGEEMSIKDQMRISREAAAKRKPYQPGDREKQRAAQMRNAAKNAKKDTRTDAEKMADATGPRPGSRYRGD